MTDHHLVLVTLILPLPLFGTCSPTFFISSISPIYPHFIISVSCPFQPIYAICICLWSFIFYLFGLALPLLFWCGIYVTLFMLINFLTWSCESFKQKLQMLFLVTSATLRLPRSPPKVASLGQRGSKSGTRRRDQVYIYYYVHSQTFYFMWKYMSETLSDLSKVTESIGS